MKKSVWIALVLMLVCIFSFSACDQGDIPPTNDDTSSVCQHTFGDWNTTKQATCKDEGELVRVCSKCSAEDKTTIVKTNIHTEVVDAAVSATCEETGLTEGKHCSHCNQVIVEQTIVGALGHKFVTYVSDGNATTEADGTKTARCENNGCNETDTTIDVGSKLPSGFDNILVESIALNISNCTMDIGDTVELVATLSPSNSTNTALAWSSSDDSIVSVSDAGVLTAKKAGNATITVTSTNGKTATCTITVSVAEISATGITLNTTNITLTVGETHTLIATVSPSTTTNQNVEWSSSNSSIVSVLNGVITAKKSGTAVIIATTSNGKIATCTVNIEPAEIAVTSISVNPTSVSLEVGNTHTLYATILPYNATNTNATWHSSNSSVATVSETGVITAIGAGTATITAKSHNNLTATCVVTVTDSKGLVFKSLGSGYAVTGYTGTDKIVEIPSEWEGLPVIAIGTGANNGFTFNTVIEEVILPTSVTTINSKAFASCTALKKISMPGVVAIESYAFQYCSSLKELVIPESCTNAGYSAFSGCIGVETLSLPSHITFNYYNEDLFSNVKTLTITGSGALDDGWFTGNTNIKTLVISNNVTSIAGSEFKNCTAIETLTIGEGITSIGTYAFSGCKAIKSINFNAIQCADFSSDNYVFAYVGNNTNGTIVTIGAKVKTLPKWIFCPYYSYSGYSPNITTVVFEQGAVCEGISDRAFQHCDKLVSVELPSCITSIGNSAFHNCDSLISIQFPTGVTSMGTSVFYDCEKLTTVTLGSIDTLGYNSFYSCENLTNIHLPTTLKTIGTNAFTDCVKLTTLIVPDSTETIGYQAFEGCRGLVSVTIGSKVSSIDDYAFRYCYKLVEVYNRSTTLTITTASSENGYLGYYAKDIATNSFATKISKDSNGFLLYSDGADIWIIGYTGTETSILLPNTANKVYQYAFYDNDDITSVTVPSNITYLGYYAFSGCESITKFTFGTTTGWSTYTPYSYDSGIHTVNAVSQEDMENNATLIQYITSTYAKSYWKKS